MIKINYFKRDTEKPADLQAGGNSQRPMSIKQSVSIPIWVKVLISLAPAMVFLIFFTFYPIINTSIIAFIENFGWQKNAGSFAISNFFQQIANANDPLLLEPPAMPYFSLDNFGLVLTDPIFLDSLFNTAILTVISVPLTIIVSLMLSVALNSIKAFRGFFQTIFFLPYVTNAIALGMVFNVLFSPEPGGIMNQIIQLFGGSPVSWVDPAAHELYDVIKLSKFSMGVVLIAQSVWAGLAFKILVFMSGLATIDKQYYDAAKIDGTGRARIFSKITVPLLSPQIFYITITSFIGAFKMYSSIISIVGQGPLNFGGTSGTLWITVVGYIYKNRQTDLPKAAAGAVILLIIVLLITLVQMQVSKKRVHY